MPKSSTNLVNKREDSQESKSQFCSYDTNDFEKMLKEVVKSDIERSRFVTGLLPKLLSCGDAVFQVEHLPGEITIKDLNSLLGTSKIEQNQVIVIKRPYMKKRFIISARIMIDSANDDEINSLLRMNGSKVRDMTVPLLIKRTSIKELEMFLNKHHGKLSRLKTKQSCPTFSSRLAKLK